MPTDLAPQHPRNPSAAEAGSASRLVPGKLIILAVVGVGLIGATGGWWYHYRLQRRPLAFWGHARAQIILQGTGAEALRLAPADGPGDPDSLETIHADDARLAVTERTDISQAPGFAHLRHSLINDGSFDWDGPADDCRPQWQYALRFSGARQTATVLFAPNCGHVMLAETGARASIRPVAEGIESFFHEAFFHRGLLNHRPHRQQRAQLAGFQPGL